MWDVWGLGFTRLHSCLTVPWNTPFHISTPVGLNCQRERQTKKHNIPVNGAFPQHKQQRSLHHPRNSAVLCFAGDTACAWTVFQWSCSDFVSVKSDQITSHRKFNAYSIRLISKYNLDIISKFTPHYVKAQGSNWVNMEIVNLRDCLAHFITEFNCLFTQQLVSQWQQPIAFRCWCGEGDLLKFNASARMGKIGVWKIYVWLAHSSLGYTNNGLEKK